MKEHPIHKFNQWFEEAKKSDRIADHTEVCLATVDNGKPSARMVLMKNADEKGFYIYTNYNSRKAKELENSPFAALCFYWNVLGKQIRVEGKVERLSDAESDAYFNSRPEDSRLGAWASKQSETLGDRKEFLDRVEEFRKKFAGGNIPRPENWGGYRLVPQTIEFWQAEDFRFHRREIFENKNGNWTSRLLYP